MLTEVQQVILTCLLGPEDRTAFKRFREVCKTRDWYASHPDRGARNLKRKARRNARRVKKALNEHLFKAGVKECSRCQEEKLHAEFSPWLRSKDGFKAYCKSCAFKAQQKYCRENPEKVTEGNRKKTRRRRMTDPSFKLEGNLRGRLNAVLRTSGGKKAMRTMGLIGCPKVWLEVHLESLFKPGMTWENYGPVWHVDHIKPCAMFDFTKPDQQSACFHWTNLQPLFALENLKKGAKYDIGK